METLFPHDKAEMFFPGGFGMENGMVELLDKISQSTTYLAIGGTVAVLFLLVFAQSIFGAKTTHSQLKSLIGHTERMNERLEEIARNLGKDRENTEGKGQEDSPEEEKAEN